MNKKKRVLPLIIGVVTLLAIIIAVVVVLTKKNEEYRVLKVENYEGMVILERDTKQEDIFEGMNLKSQDTVTTGSVSLIEILADSDKHILAEENTCFSIETTGDEEKGKIAITLEYGTSLYTIDNKLNEGSSFEVNTPNATLSVRGTTFRVSHDIATNTTILEVLDGIVEAVAESETRNVSAGETVVITEDEFVDEEIVVESDEDSSTGVLNEILEDGISEEEFPEVLKGNTNLAQLKFLLEVMQKCKVNGNENYLSIALSSIYYNQKNSDAYAPIAETSAGCTYDITSLNDMFSVMTDEQISSSNIPMTCTINGNELNYQTCTMSSGGKIAVTIDNYYVGENAEILVEYSYHMTYGSDGMSGVDGTSIAHLLPDEDGKYKITAIENVTVEEFEY